MDVDAFRGLISKLTAEIAGTPLSDDLEARLNRSHPPGSETYEALAAACRQGIAEGWLCAREAGGIKFGRPVKPGPETHGFSVDVVEMDAVVGPHHSHPNGEIDMVVPLDPEARFDGAGAGWVVYGPDTAHHPTVTGGKAIVLYLLPEGAIQFTKA
jgi:hypothetical protein